LSRGGSIREKRTVIDHQRIASYAFAFDIDGVIVRGPETIPEAKEALKMLNGDNKYHIKVPYIFVTNGGGRSESARCKELSDRLEITVTEDQVIQGHTPMKDLVDVHKTVLVVGGVGDACRKVAEEYGFEKVVTPLDIMKWNPAVTPYHKLTDDELAVARDHDFSQMNIEAILVFADSRNWAADQQIILELLLSKNGVMGTASETYDEGPGIYFAHSDFVWATDYGLSRYGMGALQVSIAALYREHTGQELQVTRFGKPQRGTFRYANKVLTHWRKDVLEEHVEKVHGGSVFSDTDEDEEEDDSSDDEPLTVQRLSQLTLDLPPASTVYFVGDTPESDIRFANSHDTSWHSILVKTGVYKDGTEPRYKPKHTCENVLEAVKYAIEREHEKELSEWNTGAIDVPVVLSEIEAVKE
jgi:HAD superfamily hydrolase (TIGR01456 family)